MLLAVESVALTLTVIGLNLAVGFLAGWLYFRRRVGVDDMELRSEALERSRRRLDRIVEEARARAAQFELELNRRSDRLESAASTVDTRMAELVRELSQLTLGYRVGLQETTESLRTERRALRKHGNETVDGPQPVRGPHQVGDERVEARGGRQPVLEAEAIDEILESTARARLPSEQEEFSAAEIFDSLELAHQPEQERRQHSRIAATVHLIVTPVAEEGLPAARSFGVVMHDISREGLSFLHTKEIEHKRLRVEIALPNGDYREVTLDVLRSQSVGHCYLIAGKFAG